MARGVKRLAGKLAGELPKSTLALTASDLVRAVLLEAADGFTLGKAIPPGPEVAEEEIQALFGIYRHVLRGMEIVAHDL